MGRYILITVLLGFAVLTLFLSASVIFDLFCIRAKEGNYVLFVVWANFLSSILYLSTAFALIAKKKWAAKPLYFSLLILIVTQIWFAIYINSGGIHETKTIGALAFRIILTLVFTFFTIRYSKRYSKKRVKSIEKKS
jgi:hypothetical protein